VEDRVFILVNLPHTRTLRGLTTQVIDDDLTRVVGLRDRSRASPFWGSPGGSLSDCHAAPSVMAYT
jgi:hypothetical protein